MDEMKRLHELTQQLSAAAHAYYTLDNPVMADVQYDQLYDELLALEKKLGVRLPSSPTHRVGGEVLEGFSEHTHITRLWSMDKVQSEGEMVSWLERMEKLRAQEGDLPELVYGIEYKFSGKSAVRQKFCREFHAPQR